MIHILSQDRKRLVNADMVAAYSIEYENVRTPGLDCCIIAKLLGTNCQLASYRYEYEAIKALRTLSDQIAKTVSGNMLFIFPSRKELAGWSDFND